MGSFHTSTPPTQTDPEVGRSRPDRKSTRLNSSHLVISYAVFCLKKKNNRTKLRVFAAGSFTNLVTAGLVAILFVSLFVQAPSGVLITSLVQGGGAEQATVLQWSVITSLNGTQVSSQVELSHFMSRVIPGQTVILHLNDGQDHVVKTKQDDINQSRALLGVIGQTNLPSRFPYLV